MLPEVPLEVSKVALRRVQLCLGVAHRTMLCPNALDDPGPNQGRGGQTGRIGQGLHLGHLLGVQADRVDGGARSVRSAEGGG